jgi:predicted ABC-class ATPase
MTGTDHVAPAPVRPAEALRPQLRGLDGKDYAAYQSLRGRYALGPFELRLDRIPKDAYAPPGTGTFRLRAPWPATDLDDDLRSTATRSLALRDFIARRFASACRERAKGRRGTGNSGMITIAQPGVAVLDRSSVGLDGDHWEVRFFVGLPARGRAIDADLATAMLLEEVPVIARAALLPPALQPAEALHHVEAAEDAEALREQLAVHGLVAFLADGAILPRLSGVDSAPLPSPPAVPLSSPPELRVTVELPHAGRVTGMGIPEGVTVIVGGGFHGKTTLLRAIEEGIYDHAPGDGRELCVTDPAAVKVRAASGRHVAEIDISPYVRTLPDGTSTRRFTSENASGSTSQAASIAEALELDARVLLMDEDTSAANLMGRDARMQQLVPGDDEPLTGLVDHLPRLARHGISTVLVSGANGAFLDVADTVIQLRRFTALDVTAKAREVARGHPSSRAAETTHTPAPARRVVEPNGLDPTGEHGTPKISAPFATRLLYGKEEVDLTDVEQLLERAQTLAIGAAIDHARRYLDGHRCLAELVARVMTDIETRGVSALDTPGAGDLAGFRPFELAATLNRLRALRIAPAPRCDE